MVVTAGGPPDAGPDQEAYAAALSALPGIGPAGLVRILAERPPAAAWDAVRAGEIRRPPPRRRGPVPGDDDLGVRPLFGDSGAEPEPAGDVGWESDRSPDPEVGPSAPVAGRGRRSWADVARKMEPERWWEPFRRRGIGVTWPGRPDYPSAFAADPQPPGVLFWRGNLAVVDARCVAIVGTRNATPDGRAVAFEMGRDLAEAGICVVSGLALGIDGAAHLGALAAGRSGSRPAPGPGGLAGRPAAGEPPEGVVGPAGVGASGVDVPYPRRHAALWEDVVRAGVVMSETVPGRPAQAWRFPARNRLIAALAELVVVVESHAGGGSLITAEAALQRGVEVRVVPGPVHSPASAGSNQLLYDGPGPVRDAQDVLDALGLFRSPPVGRSTPGRSTPAGSTPAGSTPAGSTPGQGRRAGSPARATQATGSAPPPAAALVLHEMGWRPVHAGQLMSRTGLDAATVVQALEVLAAAGAATEEGGWWTRSGGQG